MRLVACYADVAEHKQIEPRGEIKVLVLEEAGAAFSDAKTESAAHDVLIKS